MIEPSLESLVEEYLLRRELGNVETVDQFLARHPLHRAALARLLAEDEAIAGALTRDRASLAIGDVIAGYRIVREIGRGGMGVLYEARDSEDGVVALKLLSPTLALSDFAADRFRRECALTAKLDHPGIIHVFEFGQARDRDFFAMELFVAGGCDRWIARRSESVSNDPRGAAALGIEHCRASAFLTARVADALEHAHAAGIIHRDVKPSNILLRDDTTPVLTDFGLAREEGLPSLTTTGDFAGTPYYVSPEQALGGRGRVDHRADIYSLGATLFEMLTLEPPFPGQSAPEVFAKVVTKDAPDPREFNPVIPPPLAFIVMKALERDPDRRYASAEALGDDLRHWLAGRPTVARSPSPLERFRKYRRSEPARAALLAAAAVLVPLASIAGMLVVPKYLATRAAEAQLAMEREIDSAFVLVLAQRPNDGLTRFDSILAAHPNSVEAALGRVVARYFLDDSVGARTALESISASDPAIEVMLSQVQETLRGQAVGPSSSLSALGAFVQGVIQLQRATHGVGDSLPDAMALLGRANAIATRPRLSFVFARAQTAYFARDIAAARDCADTAQRHWPDSVATSWCRVWDLSLRDPKAAIAEARQLAKVTGFSESEVLIDLLFSIARRGDRALVREIINGFHTDSSPRVERASHAFTMGNCLVRIGDWTEGIELLQRAVHLRPTVATHHLALGQSLSAASRNDEALLHFQIASQLEPCNLTALANLGAAMVATGRVEEGLAICARARELGPDVAEAFFSSGLAFLTAGRPVDALHCAERGIELAPRLSNGYCLKAAALAANGDVVGAESSIYAALNRAEPSAAAHLWHARLLQVRGEDKAALEAYRQGLDLEPENARSVVVYATLAMTHGQRDAAHDAVLRYASAVGTAEAWNNAAWIFVDPETTHEPWEAERGEEYSRLALAKDPDLVPAFDTLAWSLAARGDAVGARAASDRALESTKLSKRWGTLAQALEESRALLERALADQRSR